MSRHEERMAVFVCHTYAMLARSVERACCLRIRIGHNGLFIHGMLPRRVLLTHRGCCVRRTGNAK